MTNGSLPGLRPGITGVVPLQWSDRRKAAVLPRFVYLKQALAVLLVFIGSQIFVADLFGWTKFPAEWSLGITFAILAVGVLILPVAYAWFNGRGVPTRRGA